MIEHPNNLLSETILKYLPIPVVYIDAGLQIQFFNPAFERMCTDYLGVPGDAIIGKSIPELLPALPPEHICGLEALIQGQIPFAKTGVRLEYPFEWTSRDTFWDLNLVPLPSEYTGEDGILILARDVTHRVNTDLALAQSEELVRRITNNLDVIVYRVGFKPAFHIDYVNSVIEKMSGYPVEAFYEDPQLIYRMIHPEDRHLPEQYFSTRIRESDTPCIRWIRKDGQVIWTRHKMFEIFDSDGDLIYIEGLAREVSAL